MAFDVFMWEAIPKGETVLIAKDHKRRHVGLKFTSGDPWIYLAVAARHIQNGEIVKLEPSQNTEALLMKGIGDGVRQHRST